MCKTLLTRIIQETTGTAKTCNDYYLTWRVATFFSFFSPQIGLDSLSTSSKLMKSILP